MRCVSAVNFTHEKEWLYSMKWDNMEGPWKDYVKWKKLDPKMPGIPINAQTPI